VVFEVTNWTGEIHNAEPGIHKELTWFKIDSLPKNIIPATRFYLEQIEAGKTYAEFGWDA
jgi:8-oxo-dGTP diphosphatase